MSSFSSPMSSMQTHPGSSGMPGNAQTGQSSYPFMTTATTPRMAYDQLSASAYHSQYAAAAAAAAQQQQQQQQQPPHNTSPLQQPPRTNSNCQYTQLPSAVQQSQTETTSPNGNKYSNHLFK